MDWQGLQKNFEEKYEILNKILVGGYSGGQLFPLHPLIKFCTGLALDTINNKNNNKLLIILPSRQECALWVSILCTLYTMKLDYIRNCSESKLSFTQGQKLQFFNCIVGYVGEENVKGKRFILLECAQKAIWKVPLSYSLQFQPVDTKKPLSKLENVLIANKAFKESHTTIDNVLGIECYGNRNIFRDNILLVSKIGSTSEFLDTLNISNGSVYDLILAGKLNNDGEIDIMNSGQFLGNPSFLISSEYEGVANRISSKDCNTKGLIIDGISRFVKDLQTIDDNILKSKIPIVAFTDFFEAHQIQYLEDRGFTIWQWNRDYLLDSIRLDLLWKGSYFDHLNNSLINYCNIDVTVTICESQCFDNLAENAISLDRVITNEYQQLVEPYSKLMWTIMEISRLVRIPPQLWWNSQSDKLQEIWGKFKQQRYWLSSEVNSIIDTVFDSLKTVINDSFYQQNSKYQVLEKEIDSLLKQGINRKGIIAIIVTKESEVLECQRFWANKTFSSKLNNVQFFTSSSLFESLDSQCISHIIVCGWIGKDRIYSLVHSFVTSDITILLYRFEQKWFKAYQARVDKQNNRDINIKDIADIIGVNDKELGFLKREYNQHFTEASIEDNDDIDFDLKYKSFKYSQYTSLNSGVDELIKAKVIVFNNNKFAFITESHRMRIVTELFKGRTSNQEIPSKNIEQIKIGDYVLFREVDKDILREIADRVLLKTNKDIKKDASLWRDAIRERYNSLGRNFSLLVEEFRKHGCKRCQATISNWLFDENRIGPGSEDDLEIIARVSGNKTLMDRISSVKNAIGATRSAHLQASTVITNKLISAIPKILDQKRTAKEFSQYNLNNLELEEFGQISVLRIEEIGSDYTEVNSKWINRLINQEVS